MTETDSNTLFNKFGDAVDNSLAAWESYLETLTGQPTFESIVSDNSKDASTKIKALQHILETLPSRHATLAQAYCDTEIKFAELSDTCTNLLEELQKPASNLDLSAWFKQVITGKKFISGIDAIEKDIGVEEQGRLQQLRRLKAVHVSLLAVLADGELGDKEVEVMLEAMEELGVSVAGTVVVREVAEPVKGNPGGTDIKA